MASTYSPKLRLELIGAGEQSGLWGATTNKNIGQLLEQAIAGVTTVELDGLSGNYTLTVLDGAPDQSRSAVIKCTYAVVPASGPINLIVPAQTKLYVVRNDCGQKLFVKTAAQSGGVELEDGEATLVFCDGTNAIRGLETAAAGTLPVAQGGTGQSSFTAGFVKSGGGTGALTTAATVNLGTEASGVLPVANGGTGASTLTAGGYLKGADTGAITSQSGIPASDINSGTLAAAYGGTGQSNWATGDLLYASGINTLAKRAIGANGQVLTVSGGVPTWATPASAGVTSVAISGTNISVSGSPITSSGTISISIPQDIGIFSSVRFGSLGIGTSASGTTGEIRATNNITAFFSDERLKDRLNNIENALEKLCSLSGFYYTPNAKAQELGYEPNLEVGVSAQEVQKVLPEVVVPAPISDEFLTVRYEKLVPLLIEAIKELRAEVETLKLAKDQK